MDIKTAQAECRYCFVGGGPGVVVSGLVWLAASAVYGSAGTTTAFAALFFGGMLIAPIATAVERVLFRRRAPSRDNALPAIGFETVFAMIGGLIAAFLVMQHAPQWAFPVAAIAVGARYFTFATIYGTKAYYALGGLIVALGAMEIWGRIDLPVSVVLSVAMTEILFGLALTLAYLRSGDPAQR
jgi:hypothetical protein